MQAKKIVVVGGGPAGMMAAIRAGQLKQEVILLEKNPTLGRKLILSGKGRCNLTNACNLDLFLKRFSKNGEFLRDAFKKFFNRELMDFFEARGLQLKVERQERVFPVTDNSESILQILEKELHKNQVKIISKQEIKDILIEDGRVKGVLLSSAETIPADKVILATGGVSYPGTGSTGEGLKIAEKSGHLVVDLRPALAPLEIVEHYPRYLEGLALKNIALHFSDGKRKLSSQIGEMIFTDFGISGPLVLSLSGQISDWFKEKREIFVEIDLKPALSEEQINVRLLREFKSGPKKSLKNTLKTMLPQSLVGVFLEFSEVNPEKLAGQITQKERQRLAKLFKGLRMRIKRVRPIKFAMVTRGGVSLKDIDPRTMESRLIKGLYFAGEMIDVDADTGGFNLQAAFSTGYLAGESSST